MYFTSLRSHFRVDIAELSSDCPMFVTPGIWQIGPPRVELTPRHTSHPAHPKTFVPRSFTPLLPHARYNHDFRGVVGVERWFCRSDEEWDALAQRLKQMPCPH